LGGVSKKTLQLVGATALFMASKVEEVYPARVSMFVGATDNAFKASEILEMELKMFKVFLLGVQI
jgi:cyclin E